MKITIKMKRAFLGIIGSFVGVFLNLLKIFFIITFRGYLPSSLTNRFFEFKIFGDSIMVTPIGFISIIGFGGSFWGVVFPLVLVGALFGIISAYIGFINSFESGYMDFDQWKGSPWWSFFGGMISNLIFITYVPVLAS